MTDSLPKKSSRLVWWIVAIVVILALLGSAVAGGWALFIKHSDGRLIRNVANTLPIPAASLGSHRILYRDFLHTRDTLKTFLASPAAKAQNLSAPFDQSMEKNILEKLLSQAALEELAQQKKITVSDEQLRSAFADVVSAASSTTPDVGVYLLQNFGWNEEDFRQQVLRPALLEQQLGAEMAKEKAGDENALNIYLEQRLKEKDVVRYLKF